MWDLGWDGRERKKRREKVSERKRGDEEERNERRVEGNETKRNEEREGQDSPRDTSNIQPTKLSRRGARPTSHSTRTQLTPHHLPLRSILIPHHNAQRSSLDILVPNCEPERRRRSERMIVLVKSFGFLVFGVVEVLGGAVGGGGVVEVRGGEGLRGDLREDSGLGGGRRGRRRKSVGWEGGGES